MDKEHVSITEVLLEVCIISTQQILCLWKLLSVCSSLDISELAKAAKKKLQSVSIFAESLYCAFCFFFLLLKCDLHIFMQLNNHLFEELAMDVYDEVDRRETDAGKVSQ